MEEIKKNNIPLVMATISDCAEISIPTLPMGHEIYENEIYRKGYYFGINEFRRLLRELLPAEKKKELQQNSWHNHNRLLQLCKTT
jgi:hypothetical protein